MIPFNPTESRRSGQRRAGGEGKSSGSADEKGKVSAQISDGSPKPALESAALAMTQISAAVAVGTLLSSSLLFFESEEPITDSRAGGGA